MADKEIHIGYWKNSAIDDLESVDFLFSGEKYVQALFFTHLSLEKILKDHWVKDHDENVPPKIHNLVSLFERTKLQLSETDSDFLQVMNTFQIEGRYPDYLSHLHKTTKRAEAENIISQAKALFKCLQEKLQ